MHVAREMERQGFKLPLLIGGATTSRAHTGGEDRPALQRAGRARARREPRRARDHEPCSARRARRRSSPQHQRRVREAPPNSTPARTQLVSLEKARANRTTDRVERAEDICRSREFTGVRVLDDFSLATLARLHRLDAVLPHLGARRASIPRILDAREIRRAGAAAAAPRRNALLDTIIAEEAAHARGGLRLLPANAVGDDVELYTDATRAKRRATRFHFLRQQMEKDERRAEPLARATSSRPKETGFARPPRRLCGHRGHRAARSSCDASRRSTTTTTPSWPSRPAVGVESVCGVFERARPENGGDATAERWPARPDEEVS